MPDRPYKPIPLYLPHSNTTTALNKTGSWPFFHPRYDEKTAPCSVACPVGQDIARIETLVAQGLLKEAWQLIMDENPFPAVCGRVCFHPCESACNRSHLISVADAIASGKQAALAVNTYFESGLEAVMSSLSACQLGTGPGLSMGAYLGGRGQGRNPHIVTYSEIVSDYFKPGSRVLPAILSPDRRCRSFDEIESTLTGLAAKQEATRCFNCGHCSFRGSTAGQS